MTLQPEKGRKLFELRAAQAPSKDIVTYCGACRDTFKQNSFNGISFNAKHILELLWQTEAPSSWVNRYKSVKSFDRSSKNA